MVRSFVSLRPCEHVVNLLLLAVIMTGPCDASCAPPLLGEGRVEEIIDGRSFRLSDGREIRLAGIEPAAASKAERIAALSAVVAHHDVRLHGADDAPDRYGRQTAFAYLAPDILVQALLLSNGAALVAADVADAGCTAELLMAEAQARRGKRGVWADDGAIKNAANPDEVMTGLGKFAVVEGTVLSVRQAGATTYLNFGRSWTRDFAATIARRTMLAFAQVGLTPRSFERKRVRIRGWVETWQGTTAGAQAPRIDIVRVEQLELLDGN